MLQQAACQLRHGHYVSVTRGLYSNWGRGGWGAGTLVGLQAHYGPFLLANLTGAVGRGRGGGRVTRYGYAGGGVAGIATLPRKRPSCPLISIFDVMAVE